MNRCFLSLLCRFPSRGTITPGRVVPWIVVALLLVASSLRAEEEAVALAESLPTGPPAAVGPTIEGVPGRGLLVRVDDRFSLALRSRIQLRFQHVDRDADDPSSFSMEQAAQVSTARIWLGGHALRPELTWLVQLAVAPRDFRDGTVSPIFDAFLEYRAHRDLSVRVGQFFVPFDRLRTVREWALQMTERPLAVGELTLDRDMGVQLFSDRFLGDRSPVAWRLGLFGGGGPNAVAARRPGLLAVARLELRPLGEIDDDIEGDLLRGDSLRLALGVGAARHWNAHRVRATTGPVLSGDIDFTHLAADVVVKWRGLALQGEWLRRFADARRTTVDPRQDGVFPAEIRSGWGWVAQASWIAPVPIELVARVSEVHADEGAEAAWVDVLERAGREVGAGANWYFNGHRLKVQCDALARVEPSSWSIDAYAIRLQVDATF